MNKSLIAVVTLLLGAANPVFAESANVTDAACPTRQQGETVPAFHQRERDYCEANWRTSAAAGQSHDIAVNVCLRRCYGNLGIQATGTQIGLVSGLAAVGIGLLIANAVNSGQSSPASP